MEPAAETANGPSPAQVTQAHGDGPRGASENDPGAGPGPGSAPGPDKRNGNGNATGERNRPTDLATRAASVTIHTCVDMALLRELGELQDEAAVQARIEELLVGREECVLARIRTLLRQELRALVPPRGQQRSAEDHTHAYLVVVEAAAPSAGAAAPGGSGARQHEQQDPAPPHMPPPAPHTAAQTAEGEAPAEVGWAWEAPAAAAGPAAHGAAAEQGGAPHIPLPAAAETAEGAQADEAVQPPARRALRARRTAALPDSMPAAEAPASGAAAAGPSQPHTAAAATLRSAEGPAPSAAGLQQEQGQGQAGPSQDAAAAAPAARDPRLIPEAGCEDTAPFEAWRKSRAPELFTAVFEPTECVKDAPTEPDAPPKRSQRAVNFQRVVERYGRMVVLELLRKRSGQALPCGVMAVCSGAILLAQTVVLAARARGRQKGRRANENCAMLVGELPPFKELVLALVEVVLAVAPEPDGVQAAALAAVGADRLTAPPAVEPAWVPSLDELVEAAVALGWSRPWAEEKMAALLRLADSWLVYLLWKGKDSQPAVGVERDCKDPGLRTVWPLGGGPAAAPAAAAAGPAAAAAAAGPGPSTGPAAATAGPGRATGQGRARAADAENGPAAAAAATPRQAQAAGAQEGKEEGEEEESEGYEMYEMERETFTISDSSSDEG
ncbi:hypothetical protein HYH03_009254 [Edaphochlamys debaryana]|nr:hypothetical protein HYH03_009254 [Edaphochlamys debaryana]|eukprot:KAG2492594.1 hypothetical protein HYH03_009254 [Edaphochlamys debaryana]